MSAIDTAARTARQLFLLNEWTWRGESTPPSELDIAASFSGLRWEIERSYGDERGQTRFCASGRLVVTRTPDGRFYYSVQCGSEG